MVTFQSDQIIFAAIGGIILGVATSLNYILRGKVTGMSGIVYEIVSFNKSQLPQKLSVVGGMFLASSIFYYIFGQNNYDGIQPFGPQSQMAYFTTYPGFALAGLLVGFGTKLSNGCTSGHGLCGIPRFSIRSIVAVCTFLFVAVGISTLSYWVGLGPFVNNPSLSLTIIYNHNISAGIFILIGILFPLIGFTVAYKSAKGGQEQFDKKKQLIDQIIVFTTGILFSVGLMISGMTLRKNILQFLQINQYWNPALLCVLGCGLMVNLFTFNYMLKKRRLSILGNKLFNPSNSKIDFKLVFGAACFGLGWGIGGICPGPWIVLFPQFTIPIQLIWGVSLVIGQYIANWLSDFIDKKTKQNQQKQKSLLEASKSSPQL